MKIRLRRFRPRTLARTISATLVILTTVVVLSLFAAFLYFWRSTEYEMSQGASWGFASDVSRGLQPFLSPIFDRPEAEKVLYSFLLYNPSSDVYIIGEDGRLIERYCLEICPPAVERIDLAPVREFVDAPKKIIPLLGTNPRTGGKTIFSAARILLSGKPAFLYVVLFNYRAQRLFEIFRSVAAIRMAIAMSLLIGIVASGTALFVLGTTTRRFSQIMEAVRSFESGELEKRAPEQGGDELASLGKAINSMVTTISNDIFALEEKDTRRRELISNIWHDIRGPVTAVGAFSENMDRYDSLEPSERKRMAAGVRANVNLLNRFLNDLQELGRLEMGDLTPVLTRCSLLLIAEDIFLAFRQTAQEKNVDVSLDAPAALPNVLADATMIARVLANLLENALRHTPAGGTVQLRLSAAGERVLIEVRDTGTGIHPHDLPHIFERSYQAAPNTSESGTAGLGLAIVKRMIDGHGSEIEVESAAGKGSLFRFSLPVLEEDSTSPV